MPRHTTPPRHRAKRKKPPRVQQDNRPAPIGDTERMAQRLVQSGRASNLILDRWIRQDRPWTSP